MYDLRNPSPKALLNDIGASCIAAYDNSGSVFAVASSDHQTIALFATASPDGVSFIRISDISHDRPLPPY